jgi:Ca-activated chloride channel family protein
LGNPVQGKFIDGHQSRQDASTLRQVAARLKGTYVDVNVKNVPSDAISSLTKVLPLRQGDRYALRELALAGIVIGSLLLALLPILLAKRIG